MSEEIQKLKEELDKMREARYDKYIELIKKYVSVIKQKLPIEIEKIFVQIDSGSDDLAYVYYITPGGDELDMFDIREKANDQELSQLLEEFEDTIRNWAGEFLLEIPDQMKIEAEIPIEVEAI